MAKISEVAKFFKRDHFNRLLVKIFYYPLAVLVSWIAV